MFVSKHVTGVNRCRGGWLPGYGPDAVLLKARAKPPGRKRGALNARAKPPGKKGGRGRWQPAGHGPPGDMPASYRCRGQSIMAKLKDRGASPGNYRKGSNKLEKGICNLAPLTITLNATSSTLERAVGLPEQNIKGISQISNDFKNLSVKKLQKINDALKAQSKRARLI
ncbi:hypothetical protein GGTG_11333 [Gaeumannomyces tritici R3-111a-1]|uniref:Uncharacterized protein n=1 Tax=Gaeumannomyces tritici (strain R3-111a-1) TaxID=644352 RepID=J3PCW4_GAET3|nr:hypothetical protein GGTG_11333 [Gaeumannomyces tritici R3-111a-1]EJT72086.1 hypothetical protein GGTG_11333 [Gaeumannomyces tritici R3-111a-1]